MSDDRQTDLSLNPKIVQEVLAGFIADETRRTGLKRVVVGVSGGVDSALAASLACHALGPTGVIGVLMPHEQSDESRGHFDAPHPTHDLHRIIINELHRRDFTAIRQPADEAEVNDTVESVGFDLSFPS